MILQVINFWIFFVAVSALTSIFLAHFGVKVWQGLLGLFSVQDNDSDNSLEFFLTGLFCVAQAVLWIPVVLYKLFPVPIPRETKIRGQGQENKIPLWKLWFWALFNHGFLSSVVGILCFYVRPPVAAPKETPFDSLDYFWQFIACALIVDSAFYFFHRLFHKIPSLYRFHKWHHQVIYPTALTTFYVHPIEHICVNLVPILLSLVILQPDPLFAWIWIAMSIFSAVHNHSGSNYIFLQSVEFHDHHHNQVQNGNFGVSGLFDLLFNPCQGDFAKRHE